MVQAVAGRAVLHAAFKRGILEEGQRDRLMAVFDGAGLATVTQVREWLDAGQGLDAALGRQLSRCLLRPDTPRLGAYHPLALLDEGGMGSVSLAADAAGRIVVVKTMRQKLASVPEYIKRFEREIEVMRQLDHHSLVHCLDAGLADDGSSFLVLEFVPGGTLKQVAARRGMPERQALAMIYQILDALDYVAGHQLVHRDIKPSNIFVDEERAVLADFGLARSTADDATSLTMAGSLVGTPHYMAPEQIRPDEPVDARTDLYALGAVLYFALTGRDPYSGARYEVMHAHCSAAVPEVRRVNDAVSQATESVIVKAMQKNSGDRYATAAEMRAAVAEALRGIGEDPATIEEVVVEQLAARAAAQPPAAVADETDDDAGALEPQSDVQPAAEADPEPAPVSEPGPAMPMPDVTDIKPATDRIAVSDHPTPTPGAEVMTPVADMGTPMATGATPAGPVLDPVTSAHPTPRSAPAGEVEPEPEPGPAGEPSAALEPRASEPLAPEQPVYEGSRHSQVTMFADFQAEYKEATGRDPDEESGVSRGGTDHDIRANQTTPTGGSGTPRVEDSLDGAMGPTSTEPAVASTEATVVGDHFVGDLGQAYGGDWLTLQEVGGEQRILLWARTSLVLGKMRQTPVDLCLRNFPVPVHKEACQRISRQHARLALVDRQLVMEDLGSANGSLYDGFGLMAHKPMAIAPGPEHLFVAADVVKLRIRVVHRAGEPQYRLPGAPEVQPGICGLDVNHPYDAVVMTRPENTPEFAYACVLRRVGIGGGGTEFLVHDPRGDEVAEIGLFGGRWIRRRGGHTPGAWGPLDIGDSFVAGGRTFVVGVGDYAHFH
ncbi:MAG: protein kinase [Planctomycetota bacterium]|jgi:hypothetical protein|nr:protein kinase [Planctomycetota bacterium]